MEAKVRKPRKPRSNSYRCNGHLHLIETTSWMNVAVNVCGGECLGEQCPNDDCLAPRGVQCRTVCGDYLIEH